ncbi:lipoprotein insertase outer membrane protein LolB [Edwardsiella tarda]|uniref:lipoprotein insertase outer membrane protein LolB n=1 Tax=Edwardsiella tarda TaxID=636 RepID=UPI002443EB8D|nr:lipoprotein insertase outer membrane protein LolB [Edwardsiella tarda]WGE30269.1 lipoprotein insertase outer membrane protein LolB [Edwardsiella tarda]
MKKVNLLRLLPVSCLLLAACSSLPQPGAGGNIDSPQWKAHQQQVENIAAYQTRGAFAYLSDKQKVYARFFWQQTAAGHYRLLLTNPLGSTELELNVRPGVARITDSQGRHYVSDNAAVMIEKLTGMQIPLDNLRQWMLGLPGQAQQVRLDSAQRLSQLTYRHAGQNWQVDYLRYDTRVTPPLPAQLELSQGEQRIKLKMDSWTLQP